MKALQDTAVIYVPTDTEEGQTIAQQLADQAARLFGGSTMTSGVGRYMKGLTMEVESITMVSYATIREKRREFVEFTLESVKAVGRNLKQETVAVVTNGVFGLYEAGVDYYIEDEKVG